MAFLFFQTTLAQIKVYGSCCPRSTDRVVAVSGTQENVLKAVKQIVALVNEVNYLGRSVCKHSLD